MAQELLGALDYPLSRNVEYVEIQEELEIPVHLEMKRPNETPLLWAILVNGAGEEGELLNRTIDSLYVDQTKDDLELTNEELISRIFFALDEPPRWVLLIGIDQVVLLDRSKWNE